MLKVGLPPRAPGEQPLESRAPSPIARCQHLHRCSVLVHLLGAILVFHRLAVSCHIPTYAGGRCVVARGRSP
jgi:hypothetical protein